MFRRRADPRYRRIWLGDWRRVFMDNASCASEQVEMIVVTPPGEDALPFDKSKCTHWAGVKCSGRLGCVTEENAAKAWNDTAPSRWSRLHRAAATNTRRRHGAFKIVIRAWEPQRRGVLHQNVVVAAGTAEERAAAKTYRLELSRLAGKYGFGFVDRKREVRRSLHAARYLSKYLSEGHDGKLGIGDLAARGDCPAVIAKVGRHLTTSTGSTMRSCRRRRGTWKLASHLAAVDPDRGCSIEEAEGVRRKVEAIHKMTAMHKRARARRWTVNDWHSELDRRRAELEHDYRWIVLQLAKAGLQPCEDP